MMMQVTTSPEGLTELSFEGVFTVEMWKEYQQTLLRLLDESSERLYILSDFSNVTLIERGVIMEAGTAPHLTHPRLGMLVLLGGNVLQNFILELTEKRALRENRSDKMRVHHQRDRAVETLLHFRDIHRQVDPSTANAPDPESVSE